jgi:lycopene cyclase domain-containing protein
MERLTYLLVLAGCVAVTLPLELVLGARVYRRPGLLAVTVLPVTAVFLAWDLLAHARGHWWFDHRYVLGPRVLGLPVEEWLFFVVVPVCALLTYEAVGRQRTRRTAAREPGVGRGR